MTTDLYWVSGPWPGKLAIAPRPRGGDWLEDELNAWRGAGVDVVVSLLTREEENDLSLLEEARACRAAGIAYFSLPIEDRSVPTSIEEFTKQMARLLDLLNAGKTIAVHCRQGIGRAAMVVISLLVIAGGDLEAAVKHVSQVRKCSVPETGKQRQWLTDFALSLATGHAT
jgi:protein-tyrosine phosphatase